MSVPPPHFVAVDEIVPAEGSLFVLRCNFAIDVTMTGRVGQAWEKAWSRSGRKAPPVLILDNSLSLTMLSAAELRRHGLMAIPT